MLELELLELLELRPDVRELAALGGVTLPLQGSRSCVSGVRERLLCVYLLRPRLRLRLRLRLQLRLRLRLRLHLSSGLRL